MVQVGLRFYSVERGFSSYFVFLDCFYIYELECVKGVFLFRLEVEEMGVGEGGGYSEKGLDLEEYGQFFEMVVFYFKIYRFKFMQEFRMFF